MLLDKESLLSDEQAVTVTAVTTNVYDARADNAEVGLGNLVVADFIVTTTFTAGGAATLTITLETSNDNSSYTTLATTSAIAVAALVAGYRASLTVPSGGDQYYRATYTVATGPMTAGKITAHLGPRQQSDTSVFFPRAAVPVV